MRIERARHEDLSDQLDRIGPCGAEGTAALIVQTTTVTTYPTAAGEFYACNPVGIDGSETEGGAATYTADSAQVIYCLNVGTAVPPNGTNVLASAVGGRWCFRYDG
jgi:hypothetical protein